MSLKPKTPKYSASEYNEQCALWQWVKTCKTVYPYFFHIPNEHQDEKERGRLSVTGLRKGVPDNFIALSRGGYHGMFIELKRKGGIVSLDQEQWILALRKSGYHAIVAYGWVEAVEQIGKYLKMTGDSKIISPSDTQDLNSPRIPGHNASPL